MRALTTLALLAAGCSGGEPAHETPAPAPAPEAAPATAPAPAPAPAPADTVSKDTDISKMSAEEKHAFLMKLGEKVYTTGDGGIACTTCHGPEGKGTPGAFPPLVGQKDLMADCKTHGGYVVHGLTGAITVDGQKYDSVMTAQGTMLNDLQIAAVTTFERNSWGNAFGDCAPEDVAAARTAPAPTPPQPK